MMKKIMAVTGRDLRSGIRDHMVIYILIAPFLLALILKALTVSGGMTAIHIAVDDSIDRNFLEYLETVTDVRVFDRKDEVINRVNDTDDIFGLVKEGETFDIIVQGNETEGMAEALEHIVNAYRNRELQVPVEVKISDVGWRLSPLKQQGGNLLAIFVSVFGGMIIMINLVEEKQEKTLTAVNVSSVRRYEYVIGKGLPGFIFPIVHVLAILLILDFGRINYLMVLAVTICIAMISVIIGFSIGINNDNIIGAIAGMKMIFLPIFASVFGAIFLNPKWHFLMYWSPFYWAYDAMNGIIMKEATWSRIGLDCSVIVLITAMVFMLLGRKIRRGFN